MFADILEISVVAVVAVDGSLARVCSSHYVNGFGSQVVHRFTANCTPFPS